MITEEEIKAVQVAVDNNKIHFSADSYYEFDDTDETEEIKVKGTGSEKLRAALGNP